MRFGGRAKDHGVSLDVYRDVSRGDRAEVGMWRGELVSLTVHGRTHTYGAPIQGSAPMGLGVAWLILGVVVWAAGNGRPASLFAEPTLMWGALGITLLSLGSRSPLGTPVWGWIFAASFAVFVAFLGGALRRERHERAGRS